MKRPWTTGSHSTGTLYDNVETDRLNVVNRERSGSGHGWLAADGFLELQGP